MMNFSILAAQFSPELFAIVFTAGFLVIYLLIRWGVTKLVFGIFKGAAHGIDRLHADELVPNSPEPVPLILRFEGIWEPPRHAYRPRRNVQPQMKARPQIQQPQQKVQPQETQQKMLNGRPLLQGAANRKPETLPDRFCFACGAELKPPGRFCMKCGKKQ